MAKAMMLGVSKSGQEVVNITADNIERYFTVTNGTYFFAGSGGVFTSNNKGVNTSKAETTLTAKYPCIVSFDYSVDAESYDKLYIYHNDGTVINGLGGTSSNGMSLALAVGGTIKFVFEKDSSVSSNTDVATISNIEFMMNNSADVARNVIKQNIGVSNVARNVKTGWVGVSNVAREFFGGDIVKTIHALAVGDTVTLEHSTFGSIEFVVIGDGVDKAGCKTLCATKVITERPYNSTACNWSASAIRTWLNGEFLAGFSSTVQAAIQSVSKVTNKNGSTTSTETTTDKVWLLSYQEAYATSAVSGGTHYSAAFTSDASRVRAYDGTAAYWLLRSPYTNGLASVYTVRSTGAIDYNAMSSDYGVVPCLVI